MGKGLAERKNNMFFIQSFNERGLLKSIFSRVGSSRLGPSKWFIFIMVLLAACAPSAQNNNSVEHANTINGCVHQVVEGETVNQNLFANCVTRANQKLKGPVRRELNDYLLSASHNELEKMVEIIVDVDASSYEDSTKDELSFLILKEIESIISSKDA